MRNFITYEWFTIFTILGLIAITTAKYINASRFVDFISVIGNSKYLKIYNKDKKIIDFFEGLLFFNLVCASSIFIFFTYTNFVSPLNFNLIPFIKLLFTISSVILLKIILELLVGRLFEIDHIIGSYLFQKITFKNYAGLVFLTANLFLLYTYHYPKYIILASILMISLIHLIGFMISFKNHQKTINSNLFYFLLYLCALEIAPYILLYKVIRGFN